MRSIVLGILITLTAPAIVDAHAVGDRVVVIEPEAPLHFDQNVVATSERGAVFNVLGIDGDRITVRASRKGWLDRKSVIPLKDGIEFFTRQIEHDRQDARAYVARGNVYMQFKEFDKAEGDLVEALSLNPADDHAHLVRGILWLQREDYVKARAEFDEAIKLNPRNEDAFNFRGTLWYNLGKPDWAIKDFDDAIRVNPLHGQAYGSRGLAWLRRGEFDMAILSLDQLVRLDPTNPEGFTRRALAWQKKREYGLAISDLEKALQHDENDADVHVWLAWFYACSPVENERDGRKAVEHAVKVQTLSTKPGDMTLFPVLAAAYAEAGDFESAVTWQTRAVECFPEGRREEPAKVLEQFKSRTPFRLEPKSAAQAPAGPKTGAALFGPQHHNQAVKEYAKGDHEFAHQILDHAIRADPTIAQAFALRGAIWHEKHQDDCAMADFDRAVQLGDPSGTAYTFRAEILTARNEFRKAIADYDAAVAHKPDSVTLLVNRANALRLSRQYDRAIEDTTAAIKLDPKCSRAFMNRGLCRDRKEQFDAAIADFREAIRLNPQDATALWVFGDLLATCPDAKYRNGREAVEFALKACEGNGWTDPIRLSVLAAAHAEAGNFNDAVEWQEKALELLPEAKQPEYRQRLKLYQAKTPYHRKSRRKATPSA